MTNSPSSSSSSPLVTPAAARRDEDFDTLPVFSNVVHAAAGWGHTILLLQNGEIYIAGRPYDFQTLLRMYRMPAFVRRLAVRQSLAMERRHERRKRKSSRGDEMGGSSVEEERVQMQGGTSSSFWEKLIDGIFRNSSSGDNEKEGKEAEDVFRQAIFPEFQQINLPCGDIPRMDVGGCGGGKVVAASAGLTAIVGESGKVYTFGMNHRGQCGIGNRKVYHVWEPQAVVQNMSHEEQEKEEEKGMGKLELENIRCVDLGLQHGLALDRDGKLYAWGKGSRGQLGQSQYLGDGIHDREESAVDMEYAAIPVDGFQIPTAAADGSRIILNGNDAKVRRMSAGWNHSCCLTESNHAFIWGKNAWAEMQGGKEGWKAVDAPSPTMIEGLPRDLEIKDVSCGSHHTAILMEDGSVYAMGIATDTATSVGNRPVQILPPGLIDAPVTQFSSHFDRTTILAGGNGDGNQQQILEVQLWSTDELRESAVFEPGWVETLTGGYESRVLNVQRGWLHTVVITECNGK